MPSGHVHRCPPFERVSPPSPLRVLWQAADLQTTSFSFCAQQRGIRNRLRQACPSYQTPRFAGAGQGPYRASSSRILAHRTQEACKLRGVADPGEKDDGLSSTLPAGASSACCPSTSRNLRCSQRSWRSVARGPTPRFCFNRLDSLI
jgi:hypothetical protein